LELEGCIDDEHQFKTVKRSQGLSSHTAAANTESMCICLNDFEHFISTVKNIETIFTLYLLHSM